MIHPVRFFFLLSLCLYATLSAGQIQERVLICGVCRNVEPRLAKTIQIMESIGALFEDYQILVYENNSTDRTAAILQSWAKRNPKVWLKSETLSRKELEQYIINVFKDGRLFVPEEISRARNVVLEKALSPTYKDFPYLIWMDMDFVKFPNFEGFIDTFHSTQEWDAVFAYGIDPRYFHWDLYAFRDAHFPLGSEILGNDWWYMDKTTFSLSINDPWYPVYSAFGGCGIYKKSSIQNCRYSAIVTPDLETHIKTVLKRHNDHPHVLKYLSFLSHVESLHLIQEAKPNLPKILNPNVGVILHDDPDALVFRMSSHVHQYPSVCEHVPFHASMITHGHDKLYINPKLVFYYGDYGN